MKERARARHRREAGSSDRALWPLPGRSREELERAGARDALPYRDVAGGSWADGLWLDHVRDTLDSPLWQQHGQCWSVREEMFLTWVAQRRAELVRGGGAPSGVVFTQSEIALQRSLRQGADLAGVQLARHLSTFLG